MNKTFDTMVEERYQEKIDNDLRHIAIGFNTYNKEQKIEVIKDFKIKYNIEFNDFLLEVLNNSNEEELEKIFQKDFRETLVDKFKSTDIEKIKEDIIWEMKEEHMKSDLYNMAMKVK